MPVKSQAKKPTVYPQRRVTFWLTRDRTQVGLSATADVWLVRPVRVQTPFGSYWKLPPGASDTLPTSLGQSPTHLGTWSLDQCLREAHVYPDDDSMLVRVGDEPTQEILS